MGRCFVLTLLAIITLAGCSDPSARERVDVAGANARQALNENGTLRSRLDDLEARVDELEAQQRASQ